MISKIIDAIWDNITCKSDECPKHFHLLYLVVYIIETLIALYMVIVTSWLSFEPEYKNLVYHVWQVYLAFPIGLCLTIKTYINYKWKYIYKR